MGTLTTILAIALALGLLYLKIKEVVRTIRDLRNSREERTLFFGLAIGALLTIGSCVAIERASGVPFGEDPASPTFRRVLLVLFLVGYLAFVWWITIYPQVREKARFAGGRICSLCNRPLRGKRLFRPVMPGAHEPSTVHWLYRCECGELTLYDQESRPQYVLNRRTDEILREDHRFW